MGVIEEAKEESAVLAGNDWNKIGFKHLVEGALAKPEAGKHDALHNFTLSDPDLGEAILLP